MKPGYMPDRSVGLAERRFADRLEYFASRMISRGEFLSFNSQNMVFEAIDDAMQGLILQLHTAIVALPKERIVVHEKWPADWWQAFRERWFPKSWLKRHPVRYRTVDIDKKVYERVCPHLVDSDKRDHVEFIVRDERGLPPPDYLSLTLEELQDIVDLMMTVSPVRIDPRLQALYHKLRNEVNRRMMEGRT